MVRTNPKSDNGDLLAVDLCIAPGGAVVGKHLHPEIEERFTVLRGQENFAHGWIRKGRRKIGLEKHEERENRG